MGNLDSGTCASHGGNEKRAAAATSNWSADDSPQLPAGYDDELKQAKFSAPAYQEIRMRRSRPNGANTLFKQTTLSSTSTADSKPIATSSLTATNKTNGYHLDTVKMNGKCLMDNDRKMAMNGFFKVKHFAKKVNESTAKQQQQQQQQQHNKHNELLTSEQEHNRKSSYEQPRIFTAFLTYLSFFLLMLLGFINQLLFVPKVAKERNRDGYAPLYEFFESFYSRYVYRRVCDCWNRPICSVPGAELTLKDRITNDNGWSFEFTGTETRCINLGSYNYLGFAASTGPCADESLDTARRDGLSLCSSRTELGTTPVHVALEQLTARYLGVEDAIVFGMGFATNALNLPSLLSPDSLVVSDEKNHASIILGLRLSGATIKVFKHNNMRDLERILRQGVVYGDTTNGGRPYKKIMIIVEGIFSMEGSIVRLPEVIALKKKYKAYLYLDEAHSIGSMGPNGGGTVDYFNADPKDVDILMGTFTKSFGSAGGYIAGTKKLIDFLRTNSHAHCYANAMSPPVAQQIYTSMRIIMSEDGTDVGKQKIDQLARNARYFRKRLAQIGVIVYGHEDSPVVPMLVYWYSKISAVVRTLTTRHIAVVGAGFPATPIMEGRIRFCLSAAHTKEQLDYALQVIDEISDDFGLKYSRKPRDPKPVEY